MKKIKKIFKFFVAFFFMGVLVTGCTANFCSNRDIAYKWYETYGSVEKRNTLLNEAQKTVDIPHEDFWVVFDQKTLEFATAEANARNSTYTEQDDILTHFGYVIFLDNNYNAKSSERILWKNFDNVVNEFNSVAGNLEKGPSKDFIAYYKNTLNVATQNYRTCITPTEGEFGSEGNRVEVEKKTWGDAWTHGLFEGLLVYPISWGVHQLSVAFGANGWGQLFAIILITIIVRGLMMLITFKSTAAQSKMALLQPDLAKLQSKYPNANTNQYEKQRLAQEQMELYKKHGVNPLSQLLVMIVQFPVFICVWSALQGAAILTSDSVLGLELSAPLGRSMINFSSTSCITAIVLFILMSATQIVSMKLPQWKQKKESKKIAKMGKNPAMDKTQSQTKMIGNIMLVMIIVMGISLPAAMGVYWFISALVSLGQTLITQNMMRKKK